MELLPNLFMIGAPKCGTTSLYHWIRQHPDIYMTEDKEPAFFDEDAHYCKGIEYYARRYFGRAGGCKIRGEATQSYLYRVHPVAERIREDIGTAVRFVVVLRDPVERLWSHYLHMVRRGSETLSIREALAAEEERLASGSRAWINYYSGGLYAQQLEAWFELFPRERFLILKTDELREAPISACKKVFIFLGVDREFEPDVSVRKNEAAAARIPLLAAMFNRENAITGRLKHLVPFPLRKQIRDVVNEFNVKDLPESERVLDPVLEAELRERYVPAIEELERLLGWDLEKWKAGDAAPAF